MIKPGTFGKVVSADSRRQEFDFENEQLLELNKQIDFLFMGDSITHMWDLFAFFGSDKFFVNRGIGGDSTYYMLQRFDADVIQLKPKHVIMMAGTNDILTIPDDLWWKKPGVPRQQVIDAVIENITACVQKCKKAGIRISLCSVLPNDVCVPYSMFGLKEVTLELNERIKALCEKEGLIYIDYHSSMCEPDGRTLLKHITPDGVHPNAKGYIIMAKVLKDTLNERGVDF